MLLMVDRVDQIMSEVRLLALCNTTSDCIIVLVMALLTGVARAVRDCGSHPWVCRGELHREITLSPKY